MAEMKVVRTKEEIERLEEWVWEGLEEGTHYSGMYYEEGIRNTLNWLFGATEKNPAE